VDTITQPPRLRRMNAEEAARWQAFVTAWDALHGRTPVVLGDLTALARATGLEVRDNFLLAAMLRERRDAVPGLTPRLHRRGRSVPCSLKRSPTGLYYRQPEWVLEQVNSD